MKWNPSTFFFLLTLNLSVILTVSSNNYLINWISLELSLLGFIPLFGSKIILMSDALAKYFCVQIMGSSLYLFSSLMTFMDLLDLFMPLGLLMKLGLFPFMAWLPPLMKMMTWMECALLNTLQKVNPLLILMSSALKNTITLMILLSGVMSVMLSALMGLAQTDLRMLMAYSSISHTGWLISILTLTQAIFALYMVLYYLTTFALFYLMSMMEMKKISTSKRKSFMMSLLLITLSGLPPFPLFFLKSLVLMKMSSYSLLISGTMMFSAAVSSYYYLYITMPSLTSPDTL